MRTRCPGAASEWGPDHSQRVEGHLVLGASLGWAGWQGLSRVTLLSPHDLVSRLRVVGQNDNALTWPCPFQILSVTGRFYFSKKYDYLESRYRKQIKIELLV